MVGPVLALLVLGAAAEPPVHREQVDVRAVMVDVHVTDLEGHFVSGLGAGDFEVYEDGKLQVIDTVREVHHALARVQGPPEPPSSATSRGPDVSAREEAPPPPGEPLPPRHFVFLLDLYDGVGNRGRDAAVRFAREVMGPGDRITIASYLWDLKILVEDQPFSEPAVSILEQATRGVKVKGFDPTPLISLDAASSGPSSGLNVDALLGIGKSERTMGARRLLRAMQLLAVRLEGLPGRKAVLLISDGPVMDAYSKRMAYHDFKQGIGRQFEAAEASIYAIQTNGVSAFRRDVGSNSLMSYFADHTGGRNFYNTWNFDDLLLGVASEAGSYYQVSYTSNAPLKPGAFHAIEVKVERAGLQARHRRGYTVGKSFARMDELERRDALLTALVAREPAAELPSRAGLLPLPSGSDEVWLGVALSLSGEAILPGAGGTARLEVLAEVRNGLGAPVAHLDQVLDLEGKELEAAHKRGLEWLGGLRMTRGRGSLHAVLRDATSGKMTSWDLPFDVREPEASVTLVETRKARLRAGNRKSWPESWLAFQGRPLYPRLDRRLVSAEKIGLLLELPAGRTGQATPSIGLVARDGSRHKLEPLGTASEKRTHRLSLLTVVEVPKLPAGPCRLEVALEGEGEGSTLLLPLDCS